MSTHLVKQKGFVYLASPYSCSDPELGATVRHQRFIAACRAAEYLMKKGIVVFSPIAHSHPIAEAMYGSHQDHEFWMAQDLPLLAKADCLTVLKLPGWAESKGVAMEMAFARNHKIPIKYLMPVSHEDLLDMRAA